MVGRTAVVAKAGTIRSSASCSADRVGFTSSLLLTVWCGLIAGLLEVATIVLRKQLFDSDHLYRMSRHFVWLIPLANLCVFLALGVPGSGLSLISPRYGRWVFDRFLCAITLLPSLLIAFPRIYSAAWLLVALGMAAWLVPLLESRTEDFRRFVCVSFPAAIAIVVILGVSQWAPGRILQSRENARSLPPPGSPNVILIVMDTVAAGHMSLHGYHRATNAALVELAGRGVCFESAGRRRRGRCRHMRRCSPGGGCTSSRSAGSPHLTGPIRRWRNSSGTRASDGWIRRQYSLLRHRFRAGSWLHSVSGFHLPRADRAQGVRAGESGDGSLACGHLLFGGLAGIYRAAIPCRASRVVAGLRPQRGGNGQS